MIGLILTALTMLVFFAGAVFGQEQDTLTAKVTRVIDGDTFDAEVLYDTIRVRVLALDTYETRLGKRLSKQAAYNGITTEKALSLGDSAKAYAKYLLEGKTVVLHRGDKRQPEKDIYGRWLFYVEINGLRLDEIMREKGYNAR